MRQVEFVPFKLTDVAEIFSIRIEGKVETELQEFLITFKDSQIPHLQNDFEQIIKSLIGIGEHGAKESFFRPEGKIKDRVCAIPIYTSFKGNKCDGTLRLYCIRVSDQLLIVGNGGIKTTQTYNVDETLSKYVQTLQRIDKELHKMENDGIDIYREIYNVKLLID